MSRALTVKELCERYQVGEHTVLAWIHNGELRAHSVSRRAGGRPRWRITQEALEAFELIRTPSPPPPRKRRKNRSAGIIEFY